jgi:hypothetical protein
MTGVEARAETGRAMELLRQAVDRGFREVGTMRTEPGLDPLRDREDFRLLMLDLEFPADPFVRHE